MNLYSIVIPVFNRPEELDDLLKSFLTQVSPPKFEILVIDDGSTIKAKSITDKYSSKLPIQYFYKDNSGAGHSRNYGCLLAKGNYFIFLDSDCTVPNNYLKRIDSFCNTNPNIACAGGGDTDKEDFTVFQKAVNYVMTSFLTTGGIRGKKNRVTKFEPRSFNMFISKEAFDLTGGFKNIHPGEDPELVIRIKKLGLKTAYIPDCEVFHKRRTNLSNFFKQVYKFGCARSILHIWHPESKQFVHYLPVIFVFGLLLAFGGFYRVQQIYMLYFLILFVDCLRKTENLYIALWSVFLSVVQFFGYALGILEGSLKLKFSDKPIEELFPRMFH